MGRLMWFSQLVCLQLALLHSLSCANLCSHDESSALLRFKQLFSFSDSSSSYCSGLQPDYPKMKYWKEDTDCCSWEGVSCDRVTGHVISLDLSCSWLQGNFPSNTSLFLLSHLQKLNLAYNNFNLSQIPSDFVRFPSLTHLDLSYSNFSGQVPFEITHLSKLISLDLSNNVFLTLETLVIKGLVQNMSHLQELSLGSGNPGSINMSTAALGTLTNINLPSLTYLSLSFCELQGSFPEIFINLTQLHTLDLFGNRLSGPIPSGIGRLRNLTSIDLGFNFLDGTIPSGLFSLPSLETIYLHHNQLSGPIPSGLFSLPSLETIDLRENQLSGPIPSGLFSLPSLEYIYLAGNQLSGPIPSSIFELVNLTHLNLSSNHLSGELYMFAKLKNLQYLFLDGNSLSISTTIKVNSSFPQLYVLGLSSCNINEFPKILSTADNLKSLDLSDNKIHGHIPNWLFNMTTLFSLDLSHNFVTGIEQLPRSMGLDSLDLSNNKIHGHIPNWLFNMTTLFSLDLSHNFVTGIEQLPGSMGLYSLDLSDNKIHGHIPNWLFNITTLSSLDLSHNFVTGIEQLPGSMGLYSLDLSDNKIHGHIPNWLFNITTPSSLDLSNNFLTGIEQLPRSMGLQYLDLRSNLLQGLLPDPPPFLSSFLVSHNNMTGAIPSSFCNLSSIEYLDLSNNSLYGTVPQCLGNSTTISVLDLRMNNFHGNIPQTFANGSQLTTLSLNGNQLEGSLPPSLVNCVNLEVLDLGNNMINDTFPYWLATLPELQVLILRSNRFYGPLGNSRTRIPFSKLRILDLSHNAFTGPLQTRFFKSLQAMMSGKNNSAEMSYMGDITGSYYDSVIVTMKGVDIELKRILTIFTTIDLSSNYFQGQIPDIVGKLNSLIVLNFSRNILIGHIPLSLENLTELESLDLSSNRLGGGIPTQLTSLTSLSVLNLSCNQLVGLIPQGKQFNTFENNSYIGNLGLCGLPLSKNCSNDEQPKSEPTIFQGDEDTWSWFDWKIIMMGYGSGLVIGLSMGYIVFSTGKPWWFVSLIERKVIKLSVRHGRRRN